MCARKAWAERVTEHVPQISDETILTWLRGLSHEALLTDGIEQVRSGYCFECQKNWPWSPEIATDQLCPDCHATLLTGTIDWVTLEDEPKFSDAEQEHHQMHHGWRDGPMSDCPTCKFEKKEPQVIMDFTPVEMKSTLKSSRKSIEDGDMLWFVDQIKSYMFIHRRLKGRIAVLHVLGDYSRSDPNIRSDGPKADLRVYGVEWDSPEEMEAWGVELQISKAVVEEDTTMPPLDLRSPRHDMICEYCVEPSTRVLTRDLKWVQARYLEEGDRLLGFDEVRKGRRYYQASSVTHTETRRLPSSKITLSTGEVLVASDQHRWLVRHTNPSATEWCETKDLRGKYMPRFIQPWLTGHRSYDEGFLAAAFDGEGHLAMKSPMGWPTVHFAQRQNEMLAEVEACLERQGFSYGRQIRKDGLVQINLTNKDTAFRFLSQVQPPRLMAKWASLTDQDIAKRLLNARTYVQVESVESVGEQDVVVLSTSSKTFFAEGFGAHNCVIGQMLPSGSPCENYPWTPEGTRRGSLLAKKFTMDDIEAELGAFGSATTDTKTAPPPLTPQDIAEAIKKMKASLPEVKLPSLGMMPPPITHIPSVQETYDLFTRGLISRETAEQILGVNFHD
jgi:hypothetical protein